MSGRAMTGRLSLCHKRAIHFESVCANTGLFDLDKALRSVDSVPRSRSMALRDSVPALEINLFF